MKYVLPFAFAVLSCSSMAKEASPIDAVDTLEKRFGVYKGKRRNHTKGVCFAGTFKATDIAKQYTRSQIFNTDTVTVIGRFSHAGGHLFADDRKSKTFGMALQLKNGTTIHQMAMLNLPFFDVSTPQAFIDKHKVTAPDKTTGKIDQAKFTAFKQQNPSFARLKKAMKNQRLRSDYSEYTFNSIHAFHMFNAKGQEQPARWTFVPNQVNQAITAPNSQDAMAKHFADKLKKAPIRYTMKVTFPAQDDSLTDPSQTWKTTGKSIDFGYLTITSLNSKCEPINFDPLLVSDGFQVSDDPVLKFRSPAYAISFGKRIVEASRAGK